MTKKLFYCSVVLLFFIFATVPAFAQETDYGLLDTATEAHLSTNASLPNLIGSVLGTALSLVGVLFFALMLYGGITWMLAHGNAEQEKKALSTITAAIIGILIVLGSYAITQFVFKAIQGGGAVSNNLTPSSKSCKYASGTFNAEGRTAYCKKYDGLSKEECEATKLCQQELFQLPLKGDCVSSAQKLEDICPTLNETVCATDPYKLFCKLE